MCTHSKQNIHNHWHYRIVTTTLAFSLAGCATVKNPHPDDPWESYNRTIYKFNEQVDKIVFKPTAKIYNTVVPAPLSKGVTNFFANLRLPLTIVNDVAQLNPRQAVADTWRFAINTTFGLGGLIDVATDLGLEDKPQDFGITVARWGLWKESAYIVAPFFGPTTIRDSVMIPADLAFTVWPYLRPAELNFGLFALNVVDKRAQLLKADELVKDVAVDEYTFVRDAYMQYRRNQINPGSTEKASQEDLERAYEGEM